MAATDPRPAAAAARRRPAPIRGVLALAIALLASACSPPGANDDKSCNLPEETVAENGHLYLAPAAGTKARGILVSGAARWNDSPPPVEGERGCAAAGASLVAGSLIERPFHPPEHGTDVWVAAIASPQADFEKWWKARERPQDVRLDIDEAFVACTPTGTLETPTVLRDLSTTCAFLGRMGDGAGFYPGFLEGLLVFKARPHAVAWSYVLGYWIGRILFLLLLLAFLGALGGFC